MNRYTRSGSTFTRPLGYGAGDLAGKKHEINAAPVLKSCFVTAKLVLLFRKTAMPIHMKSEYRILISRSSRDMSEHVARPDRSSPLYPALSPRSLVLSSSLSTLEWITAPVVLSEPSWGLPIFTPLATLV